MVPELDLSLVLANIAAAVERNDIPGAVVLVADPDRVHAFESMGVSAIGGPSLQTDALFRIASMTKPVVSAAAMQFVDAGWLRLDDPVERYLPEMTALTVLRSLAGGDVVPAERPVTVLDLLTQRAGFAYPGTADGPAADLLRAFNVEFLPAMPEAAWLERLAATPLMHQPGDAFTYGFSTDVLGLLLARLQGRPLGDVLKRALFDPLGMDETSFRVGGEEEARLARAYLRDPLNAELVEIPPELDCQHMVRDTFESGGAGLVSTASDYLRFARFMHDGLDAFGRTLLSRASLSLITSNHLTPAQRECPTFGVADYWSEQGFGLGVAVIDRPGPARSKSLGRYGWAGAYGTFWVNEPRVGLTALLMAQVMTLDAQPAYELQFEADLHEALP